MSETSADSLRAPPSRPPSSISLLAERLKCSNLQDTPYNLGLDESVDPSEAKLMRRARRPKAVNFTSDEVCAANPIGHQRSSANSSDVDGSSATCDSGNEDSSESWAGGAFPLSSSHAPECADGLSIGLKVYQPTLQHCLSTSAPDGPGPLFPPSVDAGAWCEAGERKSCCFCQHRLDANVDAPSRQPPSKRSCRSQSASSNQKLASSTGSRRTIARPIALRISQRALHSPATNTVSTVAAFGSGCSNSTLSSTAYALVASGCVKLRNTNSGGHQISPTTSRLSWHHPIACSGNRRYMIYPGPVVCSRHSVVFGGTAVEATGDAKLRKPPSMACIPSSASNASDFNHHRLSAFTPTTQSRRMSLTGDVGESTNPITAFFSPDIVSSFGDVGVPPSAVSRPTVSAASSGFFQDSCSLSHSSCSSSTNSDQHSIQVGNVAHHCGIVSKPVDLKEPQFVDSTTSLSVFERQQRQLQQHSCAIEEAKLRCQSQPAGAAGAPTCACGSVASAECLSRQARLKRRRCSHDVGFIWEADSSVLFGSHQNAVSVDNASFTSDAAVANTSMETVMISQEASVSPLRFQQQQGQPDLSVFPQESETAFLMSCRRKELSGLSEASEEEESVEAALAQHQHQSCCALDEYDAGTLTPPPQTRFRPIPPSPSPQGEDHHHHHHNSCSTEGSPCSFKVNGANIVVSSEDGDDEVDDEDSFGGIAPGLNHRQRCSPMQTDEGSASVEKFRELDIDMIEQD